jgi:LPXTG-site transpeptidase (sortase) family protein
MKNKLILISILGFIILFCYQKIDYKVHTYIIDNVYDFDNNMNIQDYIGYIEIPDLNIKREIVLGINEKNLLSHITLDDSINTLESNHIILAGHSVENLFGNLHKAKLNQTIYIHTNNKTISYSINEIFIVNKNEIDVLESGDLVLITCMNDNNKRLIIKAKRV